MSFERIIIVSNTGAFRDDQQYGQYISQLIAVSNRYVDISNVMEVGRSMRTIIGKKEAHEKIDIETIAPKQRKDETHPLLFNQTTCSICLEHFEGSEHVRVLPCQHCYHVKCIDRWFGDHPNCPTCKRSYSNKT